MSHVHPVDQLPLVPLPLPSATSSPSKREEKERVREKRQKSPSSSSAIKTYRPTTPKLALAELVALMSTIEETNVELLSQKLSELELENANLTKLSTKHREITRELAEKIESADTWEFYKDIASMVLNATSLTIAFSINPQLGTMLLACVGVDVVNESLKKTDLYQSLISFIVNDKKLQQQISNYAYFGLKIATSLTSLVATIVTAQQFFHMPEGVFALSPYINKLLQGVTILAGGANATISAKSYLVRSDLSVSESKQIPVKYDLDQAAEAMETLADNLALHKQEEAQILRSMYTLLQADAKAKQIASSAV